MAIALAVWGCKRTGAESSAGSGGTATALDSAPSAALPTDPELVCGRLENGFSYYLRPAHNDGGAVELALVLRVGSAAESEEERGFAHLVEHVAFDQRFGELSASEFAQRLGMSVGPDANGSTTPWATSYKLVIPSANAETLARGLDILRGFAGSVRFEESTVERQRGIVAAELRSHQDPASAVRWAHLFRGSPYAERAPGGVEAVVRQASPVQLEAFYRRWYRPQFLALVAVGQFERAELVSLIERRFASLSTSEAPPAPSLEVPLTPGEDLLVWEAGAFGLEQSSFELISRLPATVANSEGDSRLRLVDRCLARLFAFRLERLWMQPSSALDEYPTARFMSESSAGGFAALSIRSRAKPGRLRAATEALLVELERLRQHGFTRAELEQALAGEARSLRRASEEVSVQSETDRLVQLFLSADGRMSPAQEAAIGQRLLNQVDLSAVGARTAEWLNGRRSLLALRAPGDTSIASEQDLRELVREIRSRTLEPYGDASPRTLLAELPEPGKIARVEELAGPGLRLWTLQNGAKVVFKPMQGSDRVLLRAVSPGGKVHADPSRYDNARFAEQVVLDSGVGEHDIRALFRLLEGTRVQVEPWLSNDFEGFRGSSAVAELELLLQLVHLYATSPRADPRELERLRASLSEPPEPNRSFARDISAALYPGNPRFARPNPEALDAGEVLRFFRDRFGNVSDFTFVIVGDVDDVQLRTGVERYLASLPGSPRSDRRPPSRDEPRSGITRVRSWGRQGRDSAVRLEFYGLAEPSARARAEVEALALELHSALFEGLRQQRGAVYSVDVSPHWSADTFRLTISFECLPADVAALQGAVWEAIGRLTRGEIADDEVAALKARLRERYVKAMVSTQFWAIALEQAYTDGTPPQEILSWTDSSSRITRESLAASARRYLPRHQYLDAVWSPGEEPFREP